MIGLALNLGTQGALAARILFEMCPCGSRGSLSRVKTRGRTRFFTPKPRTRRGSLEFIHSNLVDTKKPCEEQGFGLNNLHLPRVLTRDSEPRDPTKTSFAGTFAVKIPFVPS